MSEIAQKISSQHEYFGRGLTQNLNHRVNALKALKDAIKKYEPDILNALAQDMAKPATEAYIAEISPVLHEINFALKHLKRWLKTGKTCTPLFLMPAKSRIIHEPYGVCLIIAPWNYPFSLCMQPLVSAIAAGNCVTIKPSSQTPVTAAIVYKIVRELYTEGFVQTLLNADHTELLQQKYDFIFFTGSPNTGRAIMQAAAQNLTPVALELGGKSPCIIDANLKNLKIAAKRIMWGKFFNAGQTCIAPDYVLAPRERKAEIIAAFKEALKNMYGENLPVIGENYTQIVNAEQWSKLAKLLESEREKIVWGGQTDAEKRYIAPTLFDNAGWDSPLMQTEIFGPLLPIVPYNSTAALLEDVAARPKPLAVYVFSEDREFYQRITQTLSFGGGCVNATLMHYVNPRLPFGGVGNSGMGRYHGKYGFETFSHAKPLLIKSMRGEPNLQYLPYNKAKFKLLKKFL